MNQSTKWVIGVIVIVAIVAVGYFVTKGPSEPVSTELIKIGAVLPLTGPGAFIGEELKKGMELANKEEKLSLIIEDSQTDPKQGVSAFNKLMAVDKINTGIVAFSSVAGAVMPIAEEKKIPVVQTVVSAAKIADGSPYSFRYFTSGEQEAPIMAKFAANNLSIKNTAILYLDGEYGLAYKDAFKNAFRSLGKEILLEETFQRTDSDFRTQLTKIKNKNPDAIYVIGLDPHLSTILKQIKELKIVSVVLTNWILAAPAVQEAAGDNDEGVYFTSPSYYFDEKTSATSEFIKDYVAAYNKQPSAYAAIGYDTIKLLAKVQKFSDTSDLINKLKQIKNFEAAMGELSVDKKGEITFPLYPVKIENQKLIKLFVK